MTDERKTIPLQGEPRTLDQRYLSDPMLSPYFRAQDTSGGSQYTVGNGNGYGWLDYSQIPGLERFAEQPSAGVSGGGDENIAAELARLGYRIYEEPITSGKFNSGQVKRGIVDAQGNFIGDPQVIDMPRDEGFWYGGLAAGAVMGAAAGGAFSGAEAATGGYVSPEIGGMAAQTTGAAEGATLAGAGGAPTAGGGLSASSSSLYTPSGYAAGGTTTSATGSTLGSSGVGAMNAADWINLGGLTLSLIQGERARDSAQDAAARAIEAGREAADRVGTIADRQLDLAEKQYADQQALLERLLPRYEEMMTLSTAETKKSIERGDSAWADYQAIWRPTEQALASRSMELADPARIEQQAQTAGLDAAGQLDAQRTENRRTMAAAGMSQEKIAALDAAASIEEAKIRGGSVDTARREGENRSVALLDNAARFGRNMPSTGLQVAQLAVNQGNQAMNIGGATQSAVAAPANASNSLFNSAAGNYGAAGNLITNAANIQRGSANDSLAFYGDLIGAGASLYGMRKP